MVITALNNQPVQDLLKEKCPGMGFPLQDISYQEALLEALQTIKTDVVLINMSIEGELPPQDFITQVRKYNPSAKIVLVLKEVNEDFRNWLVTKAVYDTFIDGQCTFEDIKMALAQERREVVIKKEIVVEEKVLEKKKVVTRKEIVKVGFKKLILPVIASTELACEMAYCTARLTDLKVTLVNLDTVKGFIDIYLGVERPDKNKAFLFAEETKGGRIPDMSSIEFCFTEVLDNLFILDLAAAPERLTAAKSNEIVDVLLSCYSLFDIIFIAVPWESPFIRHAVSMADNTIIASGAYLDELAAASGLTEKLISNDISSEKLLYLFHEYKAGVSLPDQCLRERLGERYMGKILHDDARCRSRNRDGPEGFFSRLCYPLLRSQYAVVLERFSLYPAHSSITGIKSFAISLFQKNPPDLTFALREATGVLAYAGFLLGRNTIKFLKLITAIIKMLFNPFIIILLLALLVIAQLSGVNLLDYMKNLIHLFH